MNFLAMDPVAEFESSELLYFTAQGSLAAVAGFGELLYRDILRHMSMQSLLGLFKQDALRR